MMDGPLDEFEGQLPPGVVEGLGRAYGYKVEVPVGMDRAVLGAMREKFGRRRRMRLMARWGMAISGAVAASVMVAVWMGSGGNPRAGGPSLVAINGDIDGSGRVDMVDALLLARRVQRGEKLEGAWDVNGDGKVDQADVEVIARGAVELKQGGLAAGMQRDAAMARRLPAFVELGLRSRAVVKVDRAATSVTLNHLAAQGRQEDRP